MIRTLLFILALMVASPAHAQSSQTIETFNYKAFENLPILDNGRIKPLGAFAKARLKDFYGKDKNATQWLAQTIFNPSEAINAKIFYINNDAIKERLNLDSAEDYFNLKDLQNGLQDTQKDVIALLQTNDGQGSPQTIELLKLWEKAANSYRENNASAWENDTKNLFAKTKSIAGNTLSERRLKAEIIYQTVQPYHLTMMLYVFGIIILIISISKTSRRITIIAIATLTLACIAHSSAIVARIYILDRPPVGTLYESVLFVSLICAMIGLIAYAKTHKSILPLTSQIAALGLLAIAPSMLQSNDSLELLVAVLNTNFCLATHVLCITAGYPIHS